MPAKTSKIARIALAAAIAASGAVATTAFTATAAHAASSSVDGQITRSEIIQRAQFWYGKSIAYNQGGSYPDSSGRLYRTDCSGYVSMAWHLGTSENTQSLADSRTYEISRKDLKPGDILNSYYNHVILFEKWDDAAHTKFSYYSFGSTPVRHATGVSINAASFDGHPNSEYKALRYKNVVDTTAGTGTGSVHVEIIGADGAMWNNDADYSAGTWSVWSKMDSSSLKHLASASIGSTAHYYAVAADGRVYTRDADYSAGEWSNWTEVPGAAGGAQGITATAVGNSVHLEIIGADGAMWNNDADYSAGTWGSWTKMDSSSLKHLASASIGSTAHYYAVAADGRVYTRDADYSAGRWSNWTEVPGAAGGAQGITATAVG
ncbi:hypothetical protein [Kitasatospora sp. NPDC051914]|uniref:hypothetical protein n=1 Tax=Kitasatospora sp. NPDC051914 TaxID=3154945 RepID=UPI00342B5047